MKINKKIKNIGLVACGLLPFIMPVDAAPVAKDLLDTDDLVTSSEAPWRKANFSLQLQTGSRNLTSLDILAPFMGDNDFIVYGNFQANYGDQHHTEIGSFRQLSAGFGVRRVNDQETSITGAYAFYDALTSANNNDFNQVTIGAEHLGLTWDFRANAYLPMGKTEHQSVLHTKSKIDGHTLQDYYSERHEKAMTGGDVEVGHTLGSQGLRAYFGAYIFGSDIAGPRARLTYQLNNFTQINASVQHDQLRGTQYSLGVQFSVSGNTSTKPNSIYSRLTEKVVRNTEIVTVEKSEKKVTPYKDKIWFVDADNEFAGDGTLEDPYHKLEQAIANAPEDAIILVKGENKALTSDGDNLLIMKQGQIIWGADRTLYWDYNLNAPSYASGDNIVLIQEGIGTRQSYFGSLVAATNAGIYGIDIVASSLTHEGDGVLINNQQNVTLSDVNVSGFDGAGLRLIAGASANIKNSSFSNNEYGVYVDGAQLHADNMIMETNKQSGLFLNDAQLNGGRVSSADNTGRGVEAINSTINLQSLNADANSDGVYAEGSIFQVNHMNAQNNHANGLLLNNTQLTGEIVNSVGNGNRGVELNNSNILLDNLKVTGNNGGVELNTNSTITVDQATVSENKGHAITLNSGSAQFNHLTVDGNGDLDQAKQDIDSIRYLNSAIRIGSNETPATFTVIDLSLTNNEAGIELIAGELNINAVKDQHALLDNNLGYGLFVHGNNSEVAAEQSRTVNMTYTDITNTQALDKAEIEYGTSGHGILAERADAMSLYNIVASHNAGNGIWSKRGTFVGSDITLIDNGTVATADINTNENVNLYNYGLRIDSVDSKLSMVTLADVTINGSSAQGLLVTGGGVNITNLTSNNNLDGIRYINGSLSLTNATLSDNRRFGFYIKYDATYATNGESNISLIDSVISKTKNNSEDAFTRGSGHGMYIAGMKNQSGDLISLLNTKVNSNDGLGIYIENDVNLDIADSEIRANAGNNSKLANMDEGERSPTDIKAGGIFKEFKDSNGATLKLTNSSVVDNYGSGVVMWDARQDFSKKVYTEIVNSNIDRNAGVGVRLDYALLKDSTVLNNTRTNQFLGKKYWDWGRAVERTMHPDVDIQDTEIHDWNDLT